MLFFISIDGFQKLCHIKFCTNVFFLKFFSVSIPLVYFTTENYRRMEVDAPHSLIREDSFDERHGLLELMDGNNENSDLISVQSSYGTI